MSKNNKIKDQSRGFVLLLASLLAGVFVILGASIFNISLKELVLSSGGRSSQYAFYAADSGIECALYWDFNGAFATSSLSAPEPANIFCNEQDVTVNSGWLWQDPANTTNSSSLNFFNFRLFPSDPDRLDCVIVSVLKNAGGTVIESRGYNTCDVNSYRRVERGIRVTY